MGLANARRMGWGCHPTRPYRATLPVEGREEFQLFSRMAPMKSRLPSGTPFERRMS